MSFDVDALTLPELFSIPLLAGFKPTKSTYEHPQG
jgi:hypothetical protein